MIFNVVVVQGLMNNFDKFREFVKEQHPKELMTTVEFLALKYFTCLVHSPSLLYSITRPKELMATVEFLALRYAHFSHSQTPPLLYSIIHSVSH